MLVLLSLHRPLLLEGEVCGKTAVAKVLEGIFGGKLIRLHCYEGIDTSADRAVGVQLAKRLRADRLRLVNAADRIGNRCG